MELLYLNPRAFYLLHKVVEQNRAEIEDLIEYVTNSGNFLNVKWKTDATAPPNNFHDEILGYSVGSTWIDISADKIYMCVDATANNAVWKETTGQGEFNTISSVGTGLSLYHNKVDEDLQLKSLVQGSNVTLTNSVDNKEISIASTNSFPFMLSATQIEATFTDYRGVLYFPWDHASFNDFKTSRIHFGVDVGGAGLLIQVYNQTEMSILGSHSLITTSGIYSFAVAKPSGETIVEVQIRKNGGGISPILSGVMIIFEK